MKFVFKKTFNKNCNYYLFNSNYRRIIKRNEKTLVDNKVLNNIISKKTNKDYFDMILLNGDFINYLVYSCDIDCYSGCNIRISTYSGKNVVFEDLMDSDEEFYTMYIHSDKENFIGNEDCKFIQPDILKNYQNIRCSIYDHCFYLKCISADVVLRILRYNGAFYKDFFIEYEKEKISGFLQENNSNVKRRRF